jgi:uncharacterized protein (TIGR03790 family)
MKLRIADGGWRILQAAVAAASALIAASFAVAQTPNQPSIHNPQSAIRDSPDPLAAATIVVFNIADPVSADLANFYADQRKIPRDHLVGLDCPGGEVISRADYDKKIAGPLRDVFTRRKWWKLKKTATNGTRVEENQIRFVALIRGVPLKIESVASYEGDERIGPAPIRDHNEAAVDSELATLGYFSRRISGALLNPYYRSFKKITEANLAPLMLVCRLDGPTAAIVRRMIYDSLEVERDGLWGFAYVDALGITNREDGYFEGDEWLRHAAQILRTHGIPVIMDDKREMFPASYPMRNVGLYLGWYTEQVSGPFTRDDFRFNKGAVAVHIHSSSALTLRDPHQYWAAPLLAHGAAATLGNVYEPYLTLTPNLDVFVERLLDGFTFAESAYMSQRALSWMTTFIGDPLYRPFKAQQDIFRDAPKSAAEWSAYRAGALAWFNRDRATGEKMLRESGAELRSGVIFEGLGLLQAAANDPQAAIESFRKAREFYVKTEDVLRVVIHEVGLLKATGQTEAAVIIARRQLQTFPDAPACGILRSLVPELGAAPK